MAPAVADAYWFSWVSGDDCWVDAIDDRAIVPREGVKAEMEVAQMPIAAATIADENLMVGIVIIDSKVSASTGTKS